LVILDKGCLSR